MDFTNRTGLPNAVIKEAIQNWLKEKIPEEKCPFQGLIDCRDKSVLCDQVFLKSTETTPCPCQNYSLKYVKTVARRAVGALS